MLGAADLGEVGSGSEDRENYLGMVDGLFDFEGPGVGGVEGAGVEPDFEGGGGEIFLEAESEGCAVAVGVGDEDAERRGGGHGRLSMIAEGPIANRPQIENGCATWK